MEIVGIAACLSGQNNGNCWYRSRSSRSKSVSKLDRQDQKGWELLVSKPVVKIKIGIEAGRRDQKGWELLALPLVCQVRIMGIVGIEAVCRDRNWYRA